jgi:hypothetical protein
MGCRRLALTLWVGAMLQCAAPLFAPPSLPTKIGRLRRLGENQLHNFTFARKKDILKYLNSIKTEETLASNILKVIRQLHAKEKNVRIP